jgi:hypothetical protein
MSEEAEALYAKICALINSGNIDASDLLEIGFALQVLALAHTTPDELVRVIIENLPHRVEERVAAVRACERLPPAMNGGTVH